MRIKKPRKSRRVKKIVDYNEDKKEQSKVKLEICHLSKGSGEKGTMLKKIGQQNSRQTNNSRISGKRMKTDNYCGEKLPKKVIIDTDPGSDDAAAILLLLKDPETKVLAITVTSGNSTLANTTRNVLRVLNMADRKDIPVYLGPANSILNQEVEFDCYYGKDGMGDVMTDFDANLPKPESEGAVSALTRLVDQHKGDVTLLCIAPLTNIALAQRIDNSFCSKVKECYIMGGNYRGQGNMKGSAEYNFYRDPEAAFIVLNEMVCPIVLIPWETCASLQMSWEWYGRITNTNTKCSSFLKAIGTVMVKNAKKYNQKYVPTDECAATCLINNGIALATSEIVCSVELGGFLTRGQMVVDEASSRSPTIKKNVRVVTKINRLKFKALMEDLTS